MKMEKKQKEEHTGMSIKELINSRMKAKSDTISVSLPKNPPADSTRNPADSVKSDNIDTADYKFDIDTPTPPKVTTGTTPKTDDAPLPLAAAKLAEQSGYESNNYEECLSCQ